MQERLNACAYLRDIRNRRAPADVLTMPDGREVKLPRHKEVCPACRGEGTTVNPSIDCNGLSAEDLADDPDFAEQYMDGAYDIRCGHCGGRGLVNEIDWDHVPPDVLAEARRQAAEESRDFEEHLAEIRAGC
jgi:hypothetical protein